MSLLVTTQVLRERMRQLLFNDQSARIHECLLFVLVVVFYFSAPTMRAAEDPAPLSQPSRDANQNITSESIDDRQWSDGLLMPASLFFPGTLHLATGRRDTGWRLLKAQGVVFPTLVFSAAALVVSGAAEATVMVFVPLTLVMATTWFSLVLTDLVGAWQTTQFDSSTVRYADDARWWTWFRYRSFNDNIFNTNHYCHVGVGLKEETWLVAANYGFDASSRIDSVGATLRKRLFQWMPSEQHENGIYLRLRGDYERNPVGYYRQTVMTWSMQSILPLARLSPHLNRLFVHQDIGLQQLFVRYDSQHFTQTDSQVGLDGGFSFHWYVQNYAQPFVGYTHARDTTIGGVSSGFTGVYFAGVRSQLQNFWIESRVFAGSQMIVDLTLSARWF